MAERPSLASPGRILYSAAAPSEGGAADRSEELPWHGFPAAPDRQLVAQREANPPQHHHLGACRFTSWRQGRDAWASYGYGRPLWLSFVNSRSRSGGIATHLPIPLRFLCFEASRGDLRAVLHWRAQVAVFSQITGGALVRYRGVAIEVWWRPWASATWLLVAHLAAVWLFFQLRGRGVSAPTVDSKVAMSS